MTFPGPPKNAKKVPLAEEERKKVEEFLFKHSQPAANYTLKPPGPGKKAKQAVPCRVLLGSLSFLHREFKRENAAEPSSRTVSYSTFRKYKPFFYIKPRCNSDLCNTCLDGKAAFRQYRSVCSELHEKDCAKWAEVCAGFVEQKDTELQWKMRSYLCECCCPSFLHPPAEAASQIKRLTPSLLALEYHRTIISSQKESFKERLRALKEDECLIVLDFKQNIKIGHGGINQANRNFYDLSSRVILGFVLYHNKGGEVSHEYVIVISEIIKKDAVITNWCLDLLMKTKKLDYAKTLIFWSDCGPHFRCKEGLYNFLTAPLRFPDKWSAVEMSFFGEGHGKSQCDTCFSVLSRWLTEIQHLDDISTSEMLKNAWESRARGQSSDYTFLIIPATDEFQRPPRKTELTLPYIKSYHSVSSVLVFDSAGENCLSINGKALTSNLYERKIPFKLSYKAYPKKMKYASILDRTQHLLKPKVLSQLNRSKELADLLNGKPVASRPKKRKRAPESEPEPG
jgi:hypothetical protein